MAVETLESRTFLSGTVLASVVDGALMLRGDAEANEIVMDGAGLSAGQVRVTGAAGTTINGAAEPLVLEGLTRHVRVQMGAGADAVTINDVVLPGSVTITAETVHLLAVQVGRDARIYSGDAPAFLTIDDTSVAGALHLRTGAGADLIQIETRSDAVGESSQFDGRVRIVMKSGDDVLQVGVNDGAGHQTVMTGRARLGGGAGTDAMRTFDPVAFGERPQFYVRRFESSNMSTETTAPAVSLADPGDSETGVARNRKLSATFSEAMNPQTINDATVTLTAPGAVDVAGTVSYLGTTVTFTPDAPLAANTTYTATITTGAKDLAGNALAADYVWTFETGGALDTTAPLVSSTDPANGATDVALNKKLAATFSEAMDPQTLTATSMTLTGPGSAAVAGTVTYAGATATFTPAAALTANTIYTATVTTGATDLAGNALDADFTWTFTTGATADTTAPTVSSTDPANNATGVALNKKVAATFSEAMDPLTITAANVRVTAPGGALVSGTVAYAGKTMTFTPASQLAGNTTYTATVTTGAKDLAGNRLASNAVWTFQTGATPDTTAPAVTATNPDDLKTNVPLNKAVVATFSESMDPLTVTSATVTLRAPGNTTVTGTVAYDAVAKTATFTPSSNLAPNTTFTARIRGGTTGAKDLAGNALASDKVWTFTTGTQIAQAPIVLGRAGPFAIMATAAISGTGNAITGDVGLNAGTAQGIPPAEINGDIHVTDQTIIDAQADLLAAYNDAVSRTVTSVALPGNMGGLTFTPGLYTNSTSVLISGAGPNNNVTLDAQGDPNAIFIFKMGSTLTTGPGAQVILAGGAKASNVYWQVGSSATLDTTTIFKGNILAAVTITVNNGSAVEGRLLAGSNSAGSVTVNASTVTVPTV
jgi:hypothetical protein